MMKFGTLILPDIRWNQSKSKWILAEELGFDHVWTYDHLAWRSLRDASWYGAIPVLTAAATVTSRIRIGTLVASPNFRHPVTFAKEAITLDDISNGRLILGIGAGGAGWDTTTLGQTHLSKQEKANRFEEFVTLLDQLLKYSETNWTGIYYTAIEARTIPGCVQKPRIPFAIAASGVSGMSLAAKHADIWVTTGDRTVDEPLGVKEGVRAVKEQMTQLDEICYQAGREPKSIRRLVLTGPSLRANLESQGAFQDTAAHYAEIGVTDFVLHFPRPQQPYQGNLKMFEQIMSNILDSTKS